MPQRVVEASNTNIFKTRLDKFWSDQDCKYLWKADLSGTGSRSEVLCNYDDVLIRSWYIEVDIEA